MGPFASEAFTVHFLRRISEFSAVGGLVKVELVSRGLAGLVCSFGFNNSLDGQPVRYGFFAESLGGLDVLTLERWRSVLLERNDSVGFYVLLNVGRMVAASS